MAYDSSIIKSALEDAAKEFKELRTKIAGGVHPVRSYTDPSDLTTVTEMSDGTVIRTPELTDPSKTFADYYDAYVRSTASSPGAVFPYSTSPTITTTSTSKIPDGTRFTIGTSTGVITTTGGIVMN